MAYGAGEDTASLAAPPTRGKAKPARAKAGKKAPAAHRATSGAARASAGKRRTAPPKAGKPASRGTPAAKQSKQDLVVAMLRRGGASIADLAAATGWQGERYGSLSAIAKAISGTSWNGNTFFGLGRPKKGGSDA